MSVKDGSGNLLGPGLTLDIDKILNQFEDDEKEEELKQVTFAVLRNVSTLRRIYNFYSALGHDRFQDTAFVMTKLQFWRFLKDTSIHHNLSLSAMDRAIAKNNAAEDIHSPMEKYIFKEFLSNCVVISFAIFNKEESKCLQRLINEHILKFSGKVRGHFLSEPRRAVNALAYMERCWRIYQKVCTPRKSSPWENSFCMRQFLFLLKDLKIVGPHLTTKDILKTLALDDPSVSDGDSYNLELEMTFLEFFEALIGVAVNFPSSELSYSIQSFAERSFKERTYSSATETSDAVGKIETNKESEKVASSCSAANNREEEFNIWCSKLNKFFTQHLFPAWEHTDILRNKIAKDKEEKERRKMLGMNTEEDDATTQDEQSLAPFQAVSPVTSAPSYASSFVGTEVDTYESSVASYSRAPSSVGSGISSLNKKTKSVRSEQT